jgi:hypothetical protein
MSTGPEEMLATSEAFLLRSSPLTYHDVAILLVDVKPLSHPIKKMNLAKRSVGKNAEMTAETIAVETNEETSVGATAETIVAEMTGETIAETDTRRLPPLLTESGQDLESESVAPPISVIDLAALAVIDVEEDFETNIMCSFLCTVNKASVQNGLCIFLESRSTMRQQGRGYFCAVLNYAYFFMRASWNFLNRSNRPGMAERGGKIVVRK